MIPIDVDALLAKTCRKYPFAWVTRVTRVTPSVIPSNHAGQEPLTAVTHADPLQGNTGNMPGAGAPDSEAVTLVTHLPPVLGNSRIASQGIDTARVSNTVAPVTLVTQKKEHAALALLQQLHASGVSLTPYPDGTVRCRAPHGILTPALVDAMRQNKATLHTLVEAWSERAAIAEFEAGLPRAEAEALAWAMLWERGTPMDSLNVVALTGTLGRDPAIRLHYEAG